MSRVGHIGAQWRKAPLVLRHHPTVLLAVAAAAFLVALAAASSPFVRAGAGSVALKNKLDEFSPYTAGLTIKSNDLRRQGRNGAEQALSQAQSRDDRLAAVGRQLGFVAKPVTTLVTPAISSTTAGGFTQVRLMARDGDLDHITKLSQVPGDGVWISDIAAGQLHVKPGGTFDLTGSDFNGNQTNVPVRVKGIYRALAYETAKPYWYTFFADIFPEDLDSPPPPGFAFTDRLALYRLVGKVGGLSVANVYELPVDPKGLTLDTARSLATRFDTVEQALAKRTSLAEKLHCTTEYATYVNAELGGCQVSSSLPQAIEIADSDVSAVSPVVRLLSGLGIGIALAVAAAAGDLRRAAAARRVGARVQPRRARRLVLGAYGARGAPRHGRRRARRLRRRVRADRRVRTERNAQRHDVPRGRVAGGGGRRRRAAAADADGSVRLRPALRHGRATAEVAALARLGAAAARARDLPARAARARRRARDDRRLRREAPDARGLRLPAAARRRA